MHALEYDLNIIGIPKSWLNPDSIEHGQVAIDGYKIFWRDRLEVKAGNGGGVVLCVKKEIPTYKYVELN